MSKAVEELVYDFANRQFHKAPINTARDLMCVCSDFANEFLAQPLSERLTAEEKERVRTIYNRKRFGTEYSKEVEWMEKQLLKHLFGKEIFKEGE